MMPLLEARTAVLVAAAFAYRFVSISLCAVSWRRLMQRVQRPPLARTVVLRWIGEAINSMLPWAQVGGDVVRAQLLGREGVPAPEARAVMVVDLLLALATQAAFTAVGLLGAAALSRRAPWPGGGAALGVAGLVGIGLWLSFDRIAARVERWSASSARARALLAHVSALRGIARRPGALASSFAWHLLAWIAAVGETWGVLHALGSPVSAGAAITVESLSYAARTAAFFVPGGLGAQEAALLLVGGGIGAPTQALATLALVKRGRELAVGGAGLCAWWWIRRHRAS